MSEQTVAELRALRRRQRGEPEAAAHPPEPWIQIDERGRERVVTAVLAEHIRAEGHVRRGAGGLLYRHDRGVYRPDGADYCAARVRELLGRRIRREHVGEVAAWMQTWPIEIGDEQPANTINVANGLLDWRTGELRPHSPEVLSTAQLPVRWRPEAQCPAIDRFLDEVLPDDAIGLFDEIAGLTIYAANPMQRAVLFLGPGGNGKSVALRILEALAGHANVSNVSLQAIAENRFMAAELYGRLANICGDLDARSVDRTDVFKAATGGDRIMAERKYLAPFTFRCRALMLFSANAPPVSQDQSNAWFSRWIVLPFTRTFRGTDREDPHLGVRLAAESELEGLLVRAVEGLRRLMARGRIAVPGSVQRTAEEYRVQLDSVHAFLAEGCEFRGDAFAPRARLYAEYRAWCADEGRHPLRAANLYQRLRDEYGDRVTEVARRGVRGWRGLALHDARGGEW